MPKQTKSTLMPWCKYCECYHDENAEHTGDARKQALRTLIHKYPKEATLILSGNETDPSVHAENRQLKELVERFIRYHAGVAQCESAGEREACECSVCSDARAALKEDQ